MGVGAGIVEYLKRSSASFRENCSSDEIYVLFLKIFTGARAKICFELFENFTF